MTDVMLCLWEVSYVVAGTRSRVCLPSLLFSFDGRMMGCVVGGVVWKRELRMR